MTVRQTPVCRRCRLIDKLKFAGQAREAGKYAVSLQVKACSGKVERVIKFKVNVKPTRLD